MKICIVGTGYVGLVTGTCFAEMGNTVWCVDNDKKKIDNLEKGILPIYEPGLERMVKEGYKNGNLRFTTDLQTALNDTNVVFIAVGTPMGEDGSADLSYVLSVAKEIGAKMVSDMVVVDKSTVPVGTAEKVTATIQSELDERASSLKFAVVSNPEFLKEGAAINDFMKPDRVVVGADDAEALAVMKELYQPFVLNHPRFIDMDVRSAEMTKYAANAMLATKISFINEMSHICERLGADVNKVRIGIGSDSRIGYSFIYPGCGYGGSCFPKDVQALMKTAQEHGYEPKVLSAVETVNAAQKKVLAQKIVARFGEDLNGMTFALWGLSFKPGTDDMREAPCLPLIKELVTRGAKIQAYDPEAMDEAREFYLKGVSEVSYFEDKYSPLHNADALILVTEWKEFRSPDFDEIAKHLRKKVIFDGRNQYDGERLKDFGIEYFQIGVAVTK